MINLLYLQVKSLEKINETIEKQEVAIGILS